MVPAPLPPSPQLLEPLAAWFSRHGRRLPWRAENLDLPHPDPYAVLVSELMLQQTQVATVIPYFLRWMERFPDPLSLAGAEDDEVHRFWEGLGYYRRAAFLKRAAGILAESGWPEELHSLPGVGPYTAAAVASIAFQRPEPALDGNAFRVLARLLGLREDPRRLTDRLRTWLRPALVALGPSRITQALMELGATHCAPRPGCEGCPLAEPCAARRQGLVDRIPPPAVRPSVKALEVWLVAVESGAGWLLREPAAEGLLAGLWRWPAIEDTPVPMAAEVSGRYGLEVRSWRGWTQLYSHRKERITPVAIRLPGSFPPPPGTAWMPAAQVPSLPMGRRDRRLWELLRKAPEAAADDIPAAALIRRIQSIEGGS